MRKPHIFDCKPVTDRHVIYINHSKEVYMPNILPKTEVRGCLLVDTPRAEHIHRFYYGSYNTVAVNKLKSLHSVSVVQSFYSVTVCVPSLF